MSPAPQTTAKVYHHDYDLQQDYQPYQSNQLKPEQHVNYPPPQPSRSCFSPQLTRDNFQLAGEENAAIQNQVSDNLHFDPSTFMSLINNFTHG